MAGLLNTPCRTARVLLPTFRRCASTSAPESANGSPWMVPKMPQLGPAVNVSIQDLNNTRGGRERIVILGSGWAGYTLSRRLDHKKYQVIIVSPRSYFVFTPLLASTSVGTLEFRTAVEPIRSRKNKSQYVQGWADDVDFFNKTVTIEEAVGDPNQGQALIGCRNEGKDDWQLQTERVYKSHQGQVFALNYDKLVIGVGCYNQTFNTPGVKENAHFLKDVGDARKIRRRLLECFETAALPTTSDHIRRQILHFAVVGGGPTGIEFSAELHDIIREDLSRLYPELTQFVKITLYDVAPKVLTMFDKNLAKYATDTFSREGITVKTSRKIQDLSTGLPEVDPYYQAGRPGLTLKVQDENPIGIGMCIWSTGLMMNPFIEKALGAIRRFPPKEVVFKDNVEYAREAKWQISRDKKTGSIMTNDRLRVMIDADAPEGNLMKAHMRDVFAIGDCSFIQNTQYPATAQVASQKAEWLGKRLNKGDLLTTQTGPRFKFNNLGIMAYLGNMKAIFDGGKGFNVSGRTAWVLWRAAYLVKSISWRNRVLIPIYWLLNSAFGRDISRF